MSHSRIRTAAVASAAAAALLVGIAPAAMAATPTAPSHSVTVNSTLAQAEQSAVAQSRAKLAALESNPQELAQLKTTIANLEAHPHAPAVHTNTKKLQAEMPNIPFGPTWNFGATGTVTGTVTTPQGTSTNINAAIQGGSTFAVGLLQTSQLPLISVGDSVAHMQGDGMQQNVFSYLPITGFSLKAANAGAGVQAFTVGNPVVVESPLVPQSAPNPTTYNIPAQTETFTYTPATGPAQTLTFDLAVQGLVVTPANI